MNIDFDKYSDGLVPAIIQDALSGSVLMLGFMDRQAYELTNSSGKVTFFSRKRNKIWVKGETSGNFLIVKRVLVDCDADTILVKAQPLGPTCHTGAKTCFENDDEASDVLFALEKTIKERAAKPSPHSYTSQLFARGLNKIAQKVGEEAVELVIEAKDNDDAAFKAEAADLLYHFLVLLAAKQIPLREIYATLQDRRR